MTDYKSTRLAKMFTDDLSQWRRAFDLSAMYLSSNNLLHFSRRCAGNFSIDVPRDICNELWNLAQQHVGTDGFAPQRNIGWCEVCAVAKKKQNQ